MFYALKWSIYSIETHLMKINEYWRCKWRYVALCGATWRYVALHRAKLMQIIFMRKFDFNVIFSFQNDV